ncbi:uncharacterized protein LOC117651728 [Thrips palmi]|uniref:Uncharacterized protein LOC117651728 n=1 Tax=Thrips palmi TaxID=161013 RepID=A0A6P9A3Y3_THRPL|nr:uncharacterized protein LOC117651728 [Thrips palmi]
MAATTVSDVPDVVSKTISRVAEAEGFKKPSFQVDPGSNPGDGYTSLLYRVTIREENNAGCCLPPRSGKRDDLVLMVKVPHPGTANAFLAQTFVAESTMYKSIIPAMEGTGGIEGSLPWPRCFFASSNGAETALVFEDLRLKGFGMKDRRVAMDAAHCRLALSQMAKFHGAGIALQHLKPDTFKTLADKLGNPFSSPEVQAMFSQMSEMVAQTVAIVAEKYPEGTVVYTKLLQMLQSYGAENMKMLAATPEPAPGIAIVHGDCHVNNFMFSYDQTSGDVTACQLIDFQMSRAGPTALDLASLLLPCTEKAMRDEHWEDLLRGYHAELQSVLRTAGCKDPDAVYSWTHLMDCLKKVAPHGFMIAPVLLHAQFADKEAADELRDALQDLGKEDAPLRPSTSEAPMS